MAWNKSIVILLALLLLCGAGCGWVKWGDQPEEGPAQPAAVPAKKLSKAEKQAAEEQAARETEAQERVRRYYGLFFLLVVTFGLIWVLSLKVRVLAADRDYDVPPED